MQFKLGSNTDRILFIGATIALLYVGKPLLVPLCFGALLAMLLVPVQRRAEALGAPKALAGLLSVLTILAGLAIIIALLSWQIADLTENISRMRTEISGTLDQIRQFISERLGISESRQQEMVEQNSSGGGQIAGTIVASLGGILVNIVLTLVYTFLFLFYRKHLAEFLIRMLSTSDSRAARSMIDEIGTVAFNYLSGLSLMIACLWVLYGVGFSLAGLEQPLFFALLCGLLEIVPFVGNITGTSLAIIMALVQGGGLNLALIIVGIYAVVQFIQTYVLETLVVGERVNINPLVTIVSLAAGELLWGIPGMVLAIPLTAILKIVCDHIPSLQHIGFLLGPEPKAKGKKKS